jgi:hypothetical protein
MSAVTELEAAVASIIDGELPEATRKRYHGIPVWCVADEPTVGIKPAKAHLSVLFFRGQRIPDPSGTLVGSGSFELASVKLAEPGDLDEGALRTWLRAAKANDLAGRS